MKKKAKLILSPDELAEKFDLPWCKVEVRYSDGHAVWPGYADNMTLKKGYWVGGMSGHDWYEKLEDVSL